MTLKSTPHLLYVPLCVYQHTLKKLSGILKDFCFNSQPYLKNPERSPVFYHSSVYLISDSSSLLDSFLVSLFFHQRKYLSKTFTSSVLSSHPLHFAPLKNCDIISFLKAVHWVVSDDCNAPLVLDKCWTTTCRPPWLLRKNLLSFSQDAPLDNMLFL